MEISPHEKSSQTDKRASNPTNSTSNKNLTRSILGLSILIASAFRILFTKQNRNEREQMKPFLGKSTHESKSIAQDLAEKSSLVQPRSAIRWVIIAGLAQGFATAVANWFFGFTWIPEIKEATTALRQLAAAQSDASFAIQGGQTYLLDLSGSASEPQQFANSPLRFTVAKGLAPEYDKSTFRPTGNTTAILKFLDVFYDTGNGEQISVLRAYDLEIAGSLATIHNATLNCIVDIHWDIPQSLGNKEHLLITLTARTLDPEDKSCPLEKESKKPV